MTNKQYVNAVTNRGMSIVGAAPVLGISRRQSQRIAAGDTPVPEPVGKLLNLMVKYDVKPEDVK